MATIVQRGPFKLVFDPMDEDPCGPNEVEIALRFDPSQLMTGIGTVQNAKQAYDVLAQLENRIVQAIGNVAPEIRDGIRNEAAKRIPGLAKILGWNIE